MTTELTSKAQNTQYPRVFKLRPGSPFAQLTQQLYNAVARRAYELYESRGHQDGHDLEDWFRAEAELLNSLPVEISETDKGLIVRADVPGFGEKDIEVRVAPHRLVITGKWKLIRDERTHVEASPDETLHRLNLSEAIDPDEVTATLQDGRLEIHLPKVPPGKNIPNSVEAA